MCKQHDAKVSSPYLDPPECAIQLRREPILHLFIAAKFVVVAGKLLILQSPLFLCKSRA